MPLVVPVLLLWCRCVVPVLLLVVPLVVPVLLLVVPLVVPVLPLVVPLVVPVLLLVVPVLLLVVPVLLLVVPLVVPVLLPLVPLVPVVPVLLLVVPLVVPLPVVLVRRAGAARGAVRRRARGPGRRVCGRRGRGRRGLVLAGRAGGALGEDGGVGIGLPAGGRRRGQVRVARQRRRQRRDGLEHLLLVEEPAVAILLTHALQRRRDRGQHLLGLVGLPLAEQELGTLQARADDLRGLDRLRPLREEDLGDRPCGIARRRSRRWRRPR